MLTPANVANPRPNIKKLRKWFFPPLKDGHKGSWARNSEESMGNVIDGKVDENEVLWGLFQYPRDVYEEKIATKKFRFKSR